MIKTDLKKKIPGILCLVGLILVIGLLIFSYEKTIDEIITDSTEKNSGSEKKIVQIRNKVSQGLTELRKKNEGTKEIIRTHEEEKKNLPSPEDVETTEINKVEYVEKIVYQKLYQLDTALVEALKRHLDINVNPNSTIDQIEMELERLEEERINQVENLSETRNKLAAKLKNQWVCVVGLSIGCGYSKRLFEETNRGESVFIGLSITFGKRIF